MGIDGRALVGLGWPALPESHKLREVVRKISEATHLAGWSLHSS
jgi:hypothetical protein